MDIKNLIDAIASGNTEQADETFASLMAAKADQAVKVVQDHAAATFMESEEEQIDELSKSTLGSYVKKAVNNSRINAQVGTKLDAAADRARTPDAKASKEKLAFDFKNKSWKRQDNINKAVDRLTKESVDVNEEQKDAE